MVTLSGRIVAAGRPQLQSRHFCSHFSCVLFSVRTAQQQCCLGSLRESRCLAGVNAARAGNMCREDVSNKCGIDYYKASICDQVTWQTQFSTAFASILFYCRCPLRFTGVVPNPFYLMILFNLDTNLGPDTTPDSHSLANFIIFTAALGYWTCQILIL